jgi:membrane protein
MLVKTPPLLDLARIVGRRLHEDGCLQIASSLTFFTLLSLVPLLTVALTLISAFPVFKEMGEVMQRFMVENMLPASAGAVALQAQQFTANAARLTTVGIAFLIVTSIMLMMTIERAFNGIWRVIHHRSVLQRVLIYWTLLTVGPVLIGASLSLTSWLVSVSLGLVSDIPGAGVALLKTVPIVLTSGALALLYLTMPNRRVRIRDAVFGGLLAGLLFEAMKRGFALYISQFPTYKMIFGAFASVPIFLLWVYLSWLVVLFGAVVVAALPEWTAGAGRTRAVPGGEFFDALRVLEILLGAQRRGERVVLNDLHRAVRAPVERIEAILDAMVRVGWVSRTLPPGWVLNRDPGTITVGDVYRQFVFSANLTVASRAAGSPIEAVAQRIAENVDEGTGITVEQLFAAAGASGAPDTPARKQAV